MRSDYTHAAVEAAQWPRKCSMRKRAAANTRKNYAAACGQPHRPAKALAACADAGRAAVTRPACNPICDKLRQPCNAFTSFRNVSPQTKWKMENACKFSVTNDQTLHVWSNFGSFVK